MNRNPNQPVLGAEEVRPTGWHSRTGRRSLVVGVVLGLACDLAATVVDSPWPKLAGLVLFLGCAAAIRVLTRQVADMPAERIDERQQRVQKDAYLHSYRIVGGLIALLTLALIFPASKDIPFRLVSESVQVLLFLMVVLPSCVLAWTEREA